jgi:thioredoxin-related protein
MKKITILLLALTLSIGMFAQGTKFEDLTLAQAIAKAKSNERLKRVPTMVFLDCYTTWCGPCIHMTNSVFPQKIMGDYFNANFINIKIDMEKGEGPELGKKYDVKSYPTFIIFNSNGEEIARLVGGGDAQSFIGRVRAHVDPAYKPEILKAAYEANKSLDNAIAYMDVLMHTGKRDELSVFMNDHFEEFSSSNDRFNEDFWKYASISLSSINSKLLKFIVANKNVYDGRFGRAKVNGALRNAFQSILFDYLSGKITLTNEEALRAITALSMLSDDNQVAYWYAMLANYYLNGNMERIIGLFNTGAFAFQTTDTEKMQIERLFISVQGMPKSKIREYYEGRANISKNNAERFEKEAEKYKDE